MSLLPFFSTETWILLVSALILFVVYGHWTFGVFEKLGIPGPKPFMYFGTVGRCNKVYFLDDLAWAKKYGKVWGMYELRKPIMYVTDPDMLKTILVKECFSYFPNRRDLPMKENVIDGVFFAEDDHWRRVRSLITPTLTSGHLKEMFNIMKHHSRNMIDCLHFRVQRVSSFFPSLFGPYSLDATTSCTMGVDMNTISQPLNNPFIDRVSKLFKLSLPIFMLSAMFPILTPVLKCLGISLYNTTHADYCKRLVDKVQEERRENSGKKMKDMLQHFINTQDSTEHNKGKEVKGLTNQEISSQITTLLFAGFETSTITLSFLAYNLATNPKVMKRLQEEIDSSFPNKSPFEYEALIQMEYLDSVIHESLRLYPPIARLERTAKETVRIGDVTIPKDMMVVVPVFALHHDANLWPDPEEFRPDRFSKENKKNINPYTYLPFGLGPRNCLGMRFALVMIKLALVEVLRNYSFVVCDETEQPPLEMDPSSLVSPIHPIKLKIVDRSDH